MFVGHFLGVSEVGIGQHRAYLQNGSSDEYALLATESSKITPSASFLSRVGTAFSPHELSKENQMQKYAAGLLRLEW
jgi:hypothetical protein